MSDAPERYNPIAVAPHDADPFGAMETDSEGGWVMYDDFAAVCAERDAAELAARYESDLAEQALQDLKAQKARIEALEAENARLRDALKASRNVHCGIAGHIFECKNYPQDGPVNTKGIFADSQRARLSIDETLREIKGGKNDLACK